MKILFIVITLFILASCTDAGIGKMTSLGGSADVRCWSGGQLIYEGESTGKVESELDSDGYFFRDKKTNEFMEVSGNCVINYH
jgi:hypothetical protein